MMTRTIVIGALCYCIFGCTPVIDTSNDRVPAWATGGTLHDVTLNQWVDGTDADRLATAGELLYEALWQGRLQSDENLVVFREKAERLVNMTNDLGRLLPRLIQVNADASHWTIRSLIADGMKGGHAEMEGFLGLTSTENDHTDDVTNVGFTHK